MPVGARTLTCGLVRVAYVPKASPTRISRRQRVLSRPRHRAPSNPERRSVDGSLSSQCRGACRRPWDETLLRPHLRIRIRANSRGRAGSARNAPGRLPHVLPACTLCALRQRGKEPLLGRKCRSEVEIPMDVVPANPVQALLSENRPVARPPDEIPRRAGNCVRKTDRLPP
jgi:hypothetical protein